MRLIITIMTISTAMLFFGFKVLMNPVYIIGHLKLNPKDSSAYVKKISVFVKGDNQVLAKTLTDERGDFELAFTPDIGKSFDFFCKGIGVDTIFIGSIQALQSDTLELTFYLPALRKKNALGRVICPKCKKADKVYGIIYSDGIPDYFDNEVKSSNSDFKIIRRHLYKGCIVGLAKYYCDRDKVEF